MIKYIWTAYDNKKAYCNSCAQVRSTFCEVLDGGELQVCCCHCSYIIERPLRPQLHEQMPT
jgi:hypothetical protein